MDAKVDIAPDKVVYHVNDAGAQSAGALRNINNQQFIPEATFVPSGVAEITRLQQRERQPSSAYPRAIPREQEGSGEDDR